MLRFTWHYKIILTFKPETSLPLLKIFINKFYNLNVQPNWTFKIFSQKRQKEKPCLKQSLNYKYLRIRR